MAILSRAPAVVPTAAFLVGLTFAAHSSAPPAAGPLALLAWLGLALGGRWGSVVAALALGGLLARGHDGAGPLDRLDMERPVVAVGAVSTHPTRFGDRAAVGFRLERIRQGRRVARLGTEIRLDLPAGVDPPPLGTVLRATGYLGRTPGFDNRHRSPPGRWALRVKSAAFLARVRLAGVFGKGLARLRVRVEKAWKEVELERPAAAALGRTLVLGDPRAAPLEWQRALKRTGLAHLTAVSGFNVALVALFAASLGAFLPRGLRLFAMGAATLGYLGLVGPAPSLLRATAMALVALGALWTRRSSAALQVLSLSVAALAALDPDVLRDLGFRLSVAATLGLVAAGPWLAESLELRLPRSLAVALAASLAAQAFAAPECARAFGVVSPAAPLLNLAFGAATAVALGAGLTVSALHLAGAEAISVPAQIALDLVAQLYAGLPRLPPSQLVAVAVPPHLLSGLVAGAVLLAIGRGPRAWRALALGAVSLLAAGASSPAKTAEVVVADVGQGDAILLRTGRSAVLVDGGGLPGRDLATQVLLPMLGARGLARLDAAVLSHFDFDHCSGLVDLAGFVPMGELWLPAGARTSPCSRELLSVVRGRVRFLVEGDRVEMSGIQIEVLHPMRGHQEPSRNRQSLVLLATLAGRRLLLTGDLDAPAERALVDRHGTGLRCDLLKVAHHGSRGSTTRDLLTAARPRLALVSAGVRNAYGHPSLEVLSRLRAAGALALRTDRSGGIEISWRAGRPLEISLPGSPRRTIRRGG